MEKNRVYNSGGSSKRYLVAALAAILLMSVSPKPAHAQLATCDACTTAAVAAMATLLDADLEAGFAGVEQELSMHGTEAVPMGAQVGADAHKYYSGVQSVANLAPDAYVSENSVHCAVTYGIQSRTTQETFSRAISRRLANLAARDKNAGANVASGPGMIAKEICERAPFLQASLRNGPLAQQLSNCPNPAGQAPANYTDADLDSNSVFDTMQYNAPNNMNLSATDNHVQFSPGTDFEWAFLAAFRYCEHLLPLKPPPPNRNGNLTAQDLVQAYSDMQNSVYSSSAFSQCVEAMGKRTACASGSSLQSGTNGWNCNQMQSAVCHRMHDDPPGGMGIQGVGNEEADAALNQCDGDGMSELMAKYIWAHRCGDGNYMSVVVPQIYSDTKKVEEESHLCAQETVAFDQELAIEKANFRQAVRDLQASRNAKGVDISPVAVPQ